MNSCIMPVASTIVMYYHGSSYHLPVGTILHPQDDHEERWSLEHFYHPLERYRPYGLLSHRDSVFMCDKVDDVELAKDYVDYIFVVKPLGRVERHDLMFGRDICSLISSGFSIDDDLVKDLAHRYWNGECHPKHNVWEYLTTSAEIIKVKNN